MSEFHKNDSTWCAANFFNERELKAVTWAAGDPWDLLEGLEEAGNCLCRVLSFEFVRVVDATPRRELRSSPDALPC